MGVLNKRLTQCAWSLGCSTMTMEELLKSLQKKCRVEWEEAHRQLVCALNGLAGIHIIRGTSSSAFPWEPDPQQLSCDLITGTGLSALSRAGL